jgi:hypothetical protein
MTNLNRNLVEAYKVHLFEAVSREMMVEPSVEAQGPPNLDDWVRRGVNAAKDFVDNINFIRSPATGLPAWMRDLYRSGKLSYNDLRSLFRDANGNYYMQDASTNGDGALRLIVRCDTCPSGWSYVENFPPYRPTFGGGKKLPGLQQYYPGGSLTNNTVGGWGKPANQNFWGIGGMVGLPLISDPEQYPDWDLNGDGIPDNIQSQQYMQ